jgi:hypothetical protein
VLPLAFLAPDIDEAIAASLFGRQVGRGCGGAEAPDGRIRLAKTD